MNSDIYIGEFDSEELFDNAVKSLKKANVEIEELYMPVPVHHAVREVAGRSKLPMLAYFLGIGAIIVTLSFLYYAAVISWPLNFGGKPSNSFPSFIVVTLIITIFLVTILSLFAFSVSAKLYPGKKSEVIHKGAVDDKFVIVLSSKKVKDAEQQLKMSGANEVLRKA